MIAQHKARLPRAVKAWPMNRVARGVLAAILAIAGYYATSYSLALTQKRSNVELAHRLAPGDAQIMADMALALSGGDATRKDRKRADELAGQALRHDATAVVAVAALGLNAEVRGEKSRARRLFAYAQSLSRRYLPVQLWAIEDAASSGDVARALQHYDIALRTSPESGDILFPVLAAASEDPTIRVSLIRALAGKPPWGEPFLGYLAEKGPNLRATTLLLIGLRRAGGAIPDTAYVRVVNSLAARGYADAAWAYYISQRSGADRRRSRDPRFTANIEMPSQLDWTAVETPGISTSLDRDAKGGAFYFTAPSSVGGPLLRQLQMLPAGKYRLTGIGEGIDQPDGQRPYWLVTCHDGREFGRVEMPVSSLSNGRFEGRVTIPIGCGIQMLQLSARPVDATSGLSGRIDRVQLEPTR